MMNSQPWIHPSLNCFVSGVTTKTQSAGESGNHARAHVYEERNLSRDAITKVTGRGN